MKVRFSFNDDVAEQRDYIPENVRQTIKNMFAFYDLPCVSDGTVLAFKDKGHSDDFAVMWDIILSLLRTDWFMDCAVSCVWQDEDGEEDVLVQAGKVREPGCK